jgi:putative acetyltransferase
METLNSMRIREAIIDDVPTLKELHDRAVRELCQADYTSEQIEGWVNKSPLEKYYWRLETQRIFVAEDEGKTLGFVRWYPETNELCSICVEPAFARQGIGSRLMETACQDAKENNVEMLWLDASLTAVPFYQALGWEYIALSTDGPLDNVRMTKHLEEEMDQST